MTLSAQVIGALVGRDSLSARLADPGIFRDDLFSVQQRRLFQDSVRLVEIEPHAFCNRACRFCLNAAMGQRRGIFSSDFHDRVLFELAEIGYAGTIQYARYCEPLADDRLDDFLLAARQRLPKATLKVITNGDLLTSERLQQWIRFGLDILAVSLYLPEGIPWSHGAARTMIQDFSDRLHVPCRFRRPFRSGVFANFATSGLRLDARCLDFGPGREGFDRGGGVAELTDPAFVRRDPCPFVFRTLTLDWNGNVMPCCNLHSDFAPHRDFILGNVAEQGIFAIFAGPSAAAWRRALANFAEKTGPCRHCRDARITSWRDWACLAFRRPPGYGRG
jgi:radical SAM protein with 4Fe4S-binding SPASM domain